MIQLLPGFNVIRWTSATVPIGAVGFAALVVIVYTPNPVTGQGFFTFEPGDLSPNMNVFAKSYDYLVKVTTPYLLADAVAGDQSLFLAVPGFTPTVADTAPTQSSRTETGVAAEPIIAGRLVAQTRTGLRHYSSAEETHMGLLFGIALNNASAGGSVSVRRPGYVRLPGWTLPINTHLMAGEDGRLVKSIPATSFYHLIGRSIDDETLIYQPGEPVLISTPQVIS